MVLLRQRWAGDVYLPPGDTLQCLRADRQKKEPEENKKAGKRGSWVFNFLYQVGKQLEDTLINRLRSGPRGPWQCEEGSIRASELEVAGWTGTAGEQVSTETYTRHRSGAAGLISKQKHKRLWTGFMDLYAKRQCSSRNAKRTFVQSYLDFNNIVNTLAQKKYRYIVHGTYLFLVGFLNITAFKCNVPIICLKNDQTECWLVTVLQS